MLKVFLKVICDENSVHNINLICEFLDLIFGMNNVLVKYVIICRFQKSLSLDMCSFIRPQKRFCM